MLKLFLWLRYLRKKKIVLLSIAAVGLSVALLIVTASLFSGYIEVVERTGREIFGDIHFSPSGAIPNYQQLLIDFESLEQVEAAAAYLSTYGLLYLGKGNVKGVNALGIEPISHSKVTGLRDKLLSQRDRDKELSFGGDLNKVRGFVGIGVLVKPDEETDEYDFERAKGWIGKEVVLTTGALIEKKSGGSAGKQTKSIRRRTLRFEIADVVFSGTYFRDSRDIFLPIETVRGLVSSQGSQTGRYHENVRIKLAEGIEPELMLGEIRGVWEKFARGQGLDELSIENVWIKTSGQMQEYFLVELRKQMGVLMLVFGTVCSAVVLLVFCIFYMIVMSRQKDIAIIKSCGTTSSSVASVFIGFGGCVGVVGSVLGVILGYVVTSNVNTIEHWIRIIFGIKLWRTSIYLFEQIPNQVDLNSSLWVVSFAVIAACIGSLVPAVVAAKTRPVDILRYE